MNSNTHIAMVLDRSGSMTALASEIIGGFNAFVEDQKKVPGEATLTLVQFDDTIDRLASFRPIGEVVPLTDKTYVPRGCTKLYDAIGLTVKTTMEDIAKAERKPNKVLVVILTDGMENSSQEYTTDQVRALLADRQAAGWEFTFIGANQDAVLTGRSIGLHNAAANLTFAATQQGTNSMMGSLSAATSMYRCAAQGTSYSYSEQDRAQQAIDPQVANQYVKHATFSEHGALAGGIGGTARAAALTPQQRTKIAVKAAKARWSKESV